MLMGVEVQTVQSTDGKGDGGGGGGPNGRGERTGLRPKGVWAAPANQNEVVSLMK